MAEPGIGTGTGRAEITSGCDEGKWADIMTMTPATVSGVAVAACIAPAPPPAPSTMYGPAAA